MSTVPRKASIDVDGERCRQIDGGYAKASREGLERPVTRLIRQTHHLAACSAESSPLEEAMAMKGPDKGLRSTQ